MQELIEIILYIVSITFIVFIHESGHFFASKIVNFSCEEFQIGIGPSLFNKVYKGTKYSIKAIPLGGLCTFKEFNIKHCSEENVRPFYFKKIFILFAGPFMNFFLAFLIMICVIGNVEGLKIMDVYDIQLNSTYIEQGDIIRNVNGERIYNVKDIEELLVTGEKNTITILNKDYEKKTVCFYCTNPKLGVIFDKSFENKLFGVVRTFNKYSEIILGAVADLFSNSSSIVSEMTNPYDGITGDAQVPFSFLRSINSFFMITSILSFCLGTLNLLPIVIFDGFKMITSFFSLAINRDIPTKVGIFVALIGIVISVLILF